MNAVLSWRMRACLRPLLRARSGEISWQPALAQASQAVRRWIWPGADHPVASDDLVPQLLIIDQRMPDPTLDSGSVRMLEILDILIEHGYRLTYMPDDGQASEIDLKRMQSLGVKVIGTPGRIDLPRWLRSHKPDAAFLARFHVAEEHIDLLRALTPPTRVLFDTVDLHFLRLRREAALALPTALPAALLDAIEARELAVICKVDVTFVVSDIEHELLAQKLPVSKVHVLSNIHPVAADSPGPESRRGILFVGGMGHAPNLDAVDWLAKAIFPQVRAHFPDVELHLAGEMPSGLRNELAEYPGIRAYGRIPDLQPLLHGCRVSVAPLRFGAGVKGKINSAMSHGLPVVTTGIGAEGMHLEHGRDVLIAEETAAFADAIIRLLTDDSLWKHLSAAGKENICQHFSRPAAAAVLAQALNT